MLQFYFLSVFFNLFAGFILFFEDSSLKKDSLESDSSNNEKKEKAKVNPDDDISFLDTDYRGVKLPHQKKSVEGMFSKNSVLNDKFFQLVIGLLSIITGVFKLLSAINGIPLFGDLIPALAGLLGGAALLLGYYVEKSSADLELPSFLQKVFIDNKKVIGMVCMASAVIHFVIPGVLFF